MRLREGVWAAVGLVLFAGCSAHSTATSGPAVTPVAAVAVAAVVNVEISDFAYHPATISVAPGTTVLWTNMDSYNHTVTSGTPSKPAGVFAGDLAHGTSFSFKFDAPGEYPYYCDHHPTMLGTVIVKQP